MSKFVVANWKMNKTKEEAKDFCEKLLNLLPPRAVNYCICAPFTCIDEVAGMLPKTAKVGAQDVYFADNGAFTGEISPQMISDCGATYVLVGHSERRVLMGEDDETVAKKLKFATERGLNVIYCVGETSEEHSKIVSVLKRQLKALKNVNLDKVIIAYEPLWAIGTGVVAGTDDILQAHRLIINYCINNFGRAVKVLYGGSVNPENAETILGLNDVAGVLVGGASLDAEKFAKLIEMGL